LLLEYFEYVRVINEKLCLYRLFTGMSAVAGEVNQPERCAKLFGAAQAIFDTIDYRIPQFDQDEFGRHIQVARVHLGNTAFDALAEEGRALTVDDAVALALNEE